LAIETVQTLMDARYRGNPIGGGQQHLLAFLI
jgi:hypothetical protein